MLDLSRILAGPTCTMLLGDQGADVLKVERPGVGDDTRTWGPPFSGGEAAYYLSCNRNKRSITIDLKHPRGIELVKALARISDVLVENFKPGFMRRLGLDYDSLSGINPRLVYCSVSAYGQDGPYLDRPGYDMVLSAVGGLMYITGPERGEPCKVGVAITDVLTGVHAAAAITSSLYWRERSGRGQHLDCSLLDIQVSGLANIASNWLVAGKEARRWGTAHESIVPYQVFETADRPMALAVASQSLWKSFCRLVEREEWLADPRFETNPRRVENREVLLPLVAEILERRTCAEWVELFVAASIPCGPVNDMQSLFADPQVLHREMVVEVPHPTIGALRLSGIPVKCSATPGEIQRPPPLLGQHTDEILSETLGCTPEQIAELRADGVL